MSAQVYVFGLVLVMILDLFVLVPYASHHKGYPSLKQRVAGVIAIALVIVIVLIPLTGNVKG